MNPDEITRKAGSVMSLISSFDSEMQLSPDTSAISRTSDNDSDTAMQNVYKYQDDLPHFSLTHQVCELREQAQQDRYKYLMLKIGNLQEDVAKLTGVTSALDSIAKNMKCLVDSAEMLVHIIKHPKRDDALSLPHQRHETFLNVFKNCKRVVEPEMWDTKNESIDWTLVLPVLLKVARVYAEISETVDSTLQEHQILMTDTMEVLQQLSKLSFN